MTQGPFGFASRNLLIKRKKIYQSCHLDFWCDFQLAVDFLFSPFSVASRIMFWKVQISVIDRKEVRFDQRSDNHHRPFTARGRPSSTTARKTSHSLVHCLLWPSKFLWNQTEMMSSIRGQAENGFMFGLDYSWSMKVIFDRNKWLLQILECLPVSLKYQILLQEASHPTPVESIVDDDAFIEREATFLHRLASRLSVGEIKSSQLPPGAKSFFDLPSEIRCRRRCHPPIPRRIRIDVIKPWNERCSKRKQTKPNGCWHNVEHESFVLGWLPNKDCFLVVELVAVMKRITNVW